MRGIRCALLVSALVSLPIACHSIAGIEDRSFDSNDVACRTFCRDVQATCVAHDDETRNHPSGFTSGYATENGCVSVCRLFEHEAQEGPLLFGCRETSLDRALASPGDNLAACQATGPGGYDGDCGTLCENYCAIFEKACADDPQVRQVSGAACVAQCAGLRRSGRLVDPAGTHDGDTVECRLIHAASAAAYGPTDSARRDHCGHARFQSTAFCRDEEPDCAKLCDALEVACTARNAQYESRDECLATCEELARERKGKISDTAGNTVGCRQYHTLNALGDPTHCSHAGPAGDNNNHCGDNCDAYCALVEGACPDAFETEFPRGTQQCVSECLELEGASAPYSVFDAESVPFSCRVLNTSKALLAKKKDEDTSSLCAAALGISDCR